MCTGISIDGVVDLIVARFVQTTEIEPNFRDEGVEPDRSRIRVQSVSVLVDLVVEHADRTPECWVLAIPVHGLLVCFICLVVLLTLHERPTEKIPAFCISRIGFQTLGEVRDGCVLVGKGRTRLMIQPTELLQDFGVVRVVFQYTLVGVLCSVVLESTLSKAKK